MKGFILAAGLGTRLRPYTDVIPKPLFPVLGIPLIHWVLRGMRQAGVCDVMVNLHHLPDAIVSNLGDGDAFGMNISYQFEPQILGTGGALVAADSFLRDDDSFILHNGDIFTDWDLRRLLADGAAGPVLAVVDGPGLAESDRRVELDCAGHVASLRGLPVAGSGPKVVYGGVSLLNQDVIRLLGAATSGRSSGEACLVADALIPMLAAGQPVNSVDYDGRWYCDIGTPASYLDLNMRAVLDPVWLMAKRGFDVPVQIEPGVFASGDCKIGKGVSFTGPAMICSGAVIGDGAAVGPGAVISGHVAGGACVSSAVVMAGAVAAGVVSGIVMPGYSIR